MCTPQRLRSACTATLSDQTLRLAVCEWPMTQSVFARTAKTPIRMHGCLGRSGSSLGAPDMFFFFVFFLSYCSSFVFSRWAMTHSQGTVFLLMPDTNLSIALIQTTYKDYFTNHGRNGILSFNSTGRSRPPWVSDSREWPGLGYLFAVDSSPDWSIC